MLLSSFLFQIFIGTSLKTALLLPNASGLTPIECAAEVGNHELSSKLHKAIDSGIESGLNALSRSKFDLLNPNDHWSIITSSLLSQLYESRRNLDQLTEKQTQQKHRNETKIQAIRLELSSQLEKSEAKRDQIEIKLRGAEDRIKILETTVFELKKQLQDYDHAYNSMQTQVYL